MQTYEGYIENDQFFSIGLPVCLAGRHRVILTVLDESTETEIPEELPIAEYLEAIDQLCGSIDDPTFVEQPEILWEYNTLREEII